MIICQDNLIANNINLQNVDKYMDDILESLNDEEKIINMKLIQIIFNVIKKLINQ